MIKDETEPTNAVTRRTLVKSAAWSVPIIAAAVATPLAAASDNLSVVVSSVCDSDGTATVTVLVTNNATTQFTSDGYFTPSESGFTTIMLDLKPDESNTSKFTIGGSETYRIDVYGSNGSDFVYQSVHPATCPAP